MEARYTEEMAFLHDLSCRAGAELTRRFGSDVRVRQKSDKTLVTDADLASEKVILDTLQQKKPKDKVYSEEAGLSSEDRTPGTSIWIVDPLDGTTNFANNYPFFCVSIGRGEFDKDGRIRLMAGAVHDPIRGKTYVTERGRGAWVNEKSIRVGPDRPPQDAFLVTGFAYQRGDNLRKDIEFFNAVAQTCQSIRRDGAAALDLALVAEGVYDGYWESGLRPWDLAAGALLVEEAGGIIRNFNNSTGARYDLEQGDIICGTPSVVQLISGLI
ncbi:MAG TPA: inositol monophosphatase family protein [Oligoflexus sp.]|uniref:inositol monophosphatase family protein n=1 Tax=Oligoflexus sp. TaxID=1971216 RepID=UPI002D3762FC|nr:inositol monophosphatase family protein [Oligoflexus sp.]HYX39422.1 inositol monophosphatase family protein [Oligoflexus sp.]